MGARPQRIIECYNKFKDFHRISKDKVAVLDAGCGLDSAVSRYYCDREVITIDPQLEKSDGLGIRGVAEFLPIRTNSLDVVITVSSMDHMFDRDKFIEEAHRVLKAGKSMFVAMGLDRMDSIHMWHSTKDDFIKAFDKRFTAVRWDFTHNAVHSFIEVKRK